MSESWQHIKLQNSANSHVRGYDVILRYERISFEIIIEPENSLYHILNLHFQIYKNVTV